MIVMKRLIISFIFIFSYVVPCFAELPDVRGQWNFNGTYTTNNTSKYRSFQGSFSGALYFEANVHDVDTYVNEQSIRRVTVNGSYVIGNQILPISQTTYGPFNITGRTVMFTAGGDSYTVTFYASGQTALLSVSGIFLDGQEHAVNYMGSATVYKH